MIDPNFIQFGALGLLAWVVSFQMIKMDKTLQGIKDVITSNTEVKANTNLLLEQTKEKIGRCPALK